MPRFLIERELPGAGRLTPEELQSISQKSNDVLGAMAGRAQWLQSFVTDDKLYCVYIAEDADAVAEHARAGGFPCNATQQVRTIIDPTTADLTVRRGGGSERRGPCSGRGRTASDPGAIEGPLPGRAVRRA